MLVGKPPFETREIKTTYRKIKMNDYRIPSSAGISDEAKDLIRMCLHGDPNQRPNPAAILQHPFLTSYFVPSSLPTSCLEMRPDFAGAIVAGSAGTHSGNVFIPPSSTVTHDYASKDGSASRHPLGTLNAQRRGTTQVEVGFLWRGLMVTM